MLIGDLFDFIREILRKEGSISIVIIFITCRGVKIYCKF